MRHVVCELILPFYLQIQNLNIPRVDSKKGEASFDFCGPKTWNNLPYELRSSISIESFKKNLKTFIFIVKITV